MELSWNGPQVLLPGRVALTEGLVHDGASVERVMGAYMGRVQRRERMAPVEADRVVWDACCECAPEPGTAGVEEPRAADEHGYYTPPKPAVLQVLRSNNTANNRLHRDA